MSTQSRIDWKQYFNHIYCIHYLPDKEKKIVLEKELDRVGVLNSDIFSYRFTYPTPFNEYIFSNIPSEHSRFCGPEKLRTIDTTIANYWIFKETEALGYNRILVMEDDVIFQNDLTRVKEYLDNLPGEYDFVQLDRFQPQQEKTQPVVSDDFYCENYSGGYYSSACNALSLTATRLGITLLEEHLLVPDCIFANSDDKRLDTLKRYVVNCNFLKKDNREYDAAYTGLLNFDDFYPRKDE